MTRSDRSSGTHGSDAYGPIKPVVARSVCRCPLCGGPAPPTSFAAGARGEHRLEVQTCWFTGGGRAGRPKVQARDADGHLLFKRDGSPKMVLERDEDGRPLPGPGFPRTRRDLTVGERIELVSQVRAVAQRLDEQLARAAFESAATVREFDALAEAYLDGAREEVARREQLLKEIRHERKGRK